MTNLSKFLNNYYNCPLCHLPLIIEARQEYEVFNDEIECRYFPEKKSLYLNIPSHGFGSADAFLYINEITQSLEYTEYYHDYFAPNINLIIEKLCKNCQKIGEQFIYSIRLNSSHANSQTKLNQITCKPFINTILIKNKDYIYGLEVNYLMNCFYIGEYSKDAMPEFHTYSPNLTFEDIVIPNRKKIITKLKAIRLME